METFTHDGLTFEVVDGGPRQVDSASTVVLLHGFPQTPAAWDKVTPQLHAAGLRTLAPALRGYTPESRPRKRSAYRIERLVGDVLGLLDAASVESAHIVGHDWGGGIAWQTAMQHPSRVRTLTALSTPHPGALQRAVLRSRQGLKSWYMLAMQAPVVPERYLAWTTRRVGLVGIGLPEEFQRAYRPAMEDPAAVAGMLGAYRALPFPPRSGAYGNDTPVSVPTTYMWGRRDPYLGRVAAELTARYCTGDYRFVELGAGHWLPEKRPSEVSEEILRRIG